MVDGDVSLEQTSVDDRGIIEAFEDPQLILVHLVIRDRQLLFEQSDGGGRAVHLDPQVAALGACEVREGDLIEQLPLVEDPDAVGEHLHLGELVAGEEDGDLALTAQFLEKLPNLYDPVGIEAVSGLIQNQEFRIGDQRPDDPQALLHPHGEGAHLLVGGHCEPSHLEEPVDLVGLGDPQQVGEDHQVLTSREVGVKPRSFDQGSHTREHFFAGTDLFSENLDAAAIGLGEPQEHPEGRGLSGTIVAEKTVDLSFFHGEGQVIYSGGGTVAFGQAYRSDHGHVHHFLSIVFCTHDTPET